MKITRKYYTNIMNYMHHKHPAGWLRLCSILGKGEVKYTDFADDLIKSGYDIEFSYGGNSLQTYWIKEERVPNSAGTVSSDTKTIGPKHIDEIHRRLIAKGVAYKDRQKLIDSVRYFTEFPKTWFDLYCKNNPNLKIYKGIRPNWYYVPTINNDSNVISAERKYEDKDVGNYPQPNFVSNEVYDSKVLIPGKTKHTALGSKDKAKQFYQSVRNRYRRQRAKEIVYNIIGM